MATSSQLNKKTDLLVLQNQFAVQRRALRQEEMELTATIASWQERRSRIDAALDELRRKLNVPQPS